MFSRSLVHLDLFGNKLEGSIPEALGNLSALEYLSLGANDLEGFIPETMGNMTALMLREVHAAENILGRWKLPEQTQLLSRCTHFSLEYLDLGYNQIMGSLPNLTLFSSMKDLSLPGNQFSGNIHEIVGQYAQLEVLHLFGNSLEVGFFRTSFLQVRPSVPKMASNSKGLFFIGYYNAGISDSIPTWFWDISTNCYSMDLCNNQIHGTITRTSFEFIDYPKVNLSSNKLDGSIPHFMLKVGALDLSENRFSKLDSLCNISNDSQLGFLDVSVNQLSGDLPDCWLHYKELRVLVLANNKLSGKIPISIGSLTQIITLNLGNNGLTGELPSSLKRNSLSGEIPSKIGNLKSLDALDLSNNRLSGEIPFSHSQVDRLGRLDLSNNNLSGKIPEMNRVFLEDPAARNEDGFETPGFYASLGLGFLVGLWGFCGTLIFNGAWRYSYFNFFNDLKDWMHIMAAEFKAKLLGIIKI
ncbi:LRR domain containing protein [Parasponia andersonii]|uniref:LRR domain containing protein n=1 Tax=Parasponia andersonii TaxID=3476 RepID=A0A2P5B053_PARAD|nr:LRR domain containing protein [Parasponia andersonii]